MKVLFIDTVHEVLEQRLKAHDFECIDATGWSEQECIDRLADVQGIVIRSRFRLDASFLRHAPNLKFIARSGAGMENIEEEYAEQRGITLFNAPEGNRNAVGEHALGMLLSLFNNLNKADNEVRNGIWDREGNRGVELDGKKVGIIGYGNNGAAFAKKLAGFDVEILAYDKYKSNYGTAQVREVELAQIFAESDIVSFHIPQNEETLFMGNEAFFGAFKKSIYVINLSRGKIISTDSLVHAMKNGKVLGACLDVLEYESTSFENVFHQDDRGEALDYILKSPQTILSPHVGGWTKESYFLLSNVLADKILDQYT